MQPDRVVETCLYVSDVEAAAAWYQRVLGLKRVSADPPRHVFLAAGDSMLLLFDAKETREEGSATAHGATGPQHVALGVQELDAWREQLSGHDVAVTEEQTWPGGGASLYFQDPDGNVVELVTRGTWPVW